MPGDVSAAELLLQGVERAAGGKSIRTGVSQDRV